MFGTQKVTQLHTAFISAMKLKVSRGNTQKKLHEYPPTHCGVQMDSHKGTKEQKYGN
jgi:hypothetical protein